MFKKKPHVWMAVHDDDLLWLSMDPSDLGRCIFRLPLEQILENGRATRSVPDYLRGNNRFLCLVPDHWFGMESYPFRSRKPSLIEAFLERKLSASHPGLKSITQFFSYQRNAAEDGQDTLYAHFLQEEKAYRFNRTLSKADLTPLGYTTPAFLWEEILRKSSPAFVTRGSLLAHICDRQGRLYFYYNGIYQFSRVVMLPDDDAERIGAITYEISQSLYLFSQKTKSELNQVYLHPDACVLREALEDTLGRKVTPCAKLLVENPGEIAFSEVPTLGGVLAMNQPRQNSSVFSVIHRKIKRQMEWQPIRRMGVALGLLMVLLLMGEALFLRSALHEAELDQRHLNRQMRSATTRELTDYTLAFEQVRQRIQQPAVPETIQKTVACLPGNVQLTKLDLTLEAPPRLIVEALVTCRDTDQLRLTLSELVARSKTLFQGARALSLGDIDVGTAPVDRRTTLPRFSITFQVELD